MEVVRQHPLKEQSHEAVVNLRYADVNLTTVRRERCFALSERFETSALVTSRIWREGSGVTTIKRLPTFVVRPLL